MASAGHYQRSFTPTPPLKGAFPLDKEGLCKTEMLEFMLCMHDKSSLNHECQPRIREYLECRMRNGLMDQEEFHKLGLGKVDKVSEHKT